MNLNIKNNEFFDIVTKKKRTATDVAYQTEHLNFSDDERIIQTKTGTAQLYVGKDIIAMAHKGNGVLVTDVGTLIGGNLHITKVPSSIRMSSFWTFNDELMTTVPSTTYTPIPVLVYSEPPYAKQLARVTKLLSSLG